MYSFNVAKDDAKHAQKWLAENLSKAVEKKTVRGLDTEVVGRGVEEVQKLLDHHRKGVSGKKPVLVL